jgi:GNAT superfamily N-acetyltransferase
MTEESIGPSDPVGIGRRRPFATWARLATPVDLYEILTLHKACFPSNNGDHETIVKPAITGSVQDRMVHVHEQDGRIVAFIELERPLTHHVVVRTIAVQPEYRTRRIASQLLDWTIQTESRTSRKFSLTAAPDDHVLLRLAFSHGFNACATQLDAGGFRLYLQRQEPRNFHIRHDESILLESGSLKQISEMLMSGEHIITRLTHDNTAFEIARIGRDDLSTLRSEENSGSISFAGSMLAAITFILGMSFTSDTFPNDVRILLIAATFSTLLSLVIYTNAIGDLSRIRSDEYDEHSRWGNILSEYGGVLPFLISLPVAFAEVSDSFWAALITAAASSAALLSYIRSKFSISSRYPSSRTTNTLHVVACSDPVLGVVTTKYFSVAWPWTVATIALLIWLSCVYLFQHREETSVR